MLLNVTLVAVPGRASPTIQSVADVSPSSWM